MFGALRIMAERSLESNQEAYICIVDYEKAFDRVKTEGKYSKPESIGREVRQGYPLSPILFNLYIEELVQEALQDSEEGVKVSLVGKYHH